MNRSSPMLHSDIAARVVLMCGVSGSGKTFFSRELEKNGYVRLSVDELLWELYGPMSHRVPLEEQRVMIAGAMEELRRQMATHLEAGERVVVDATFCKRAKRRSFVEFCRNRGAEPLFVYMKAGLPLLKERMKRREGRGPNDQIVPSERLSLFFSNFESPGADENFITVAESED